MDDAEQTVIVVLPSSTELFYVYGQTLEGCATLSTGRPLFDLLEVFKKWLRVYAGEKEKLLHHISVVYPYLCPQRMCSCLKCAGGFCNSIQYSLLDLTAPRTRPQLRRSIEVRHDMNEIRNACRVINTAEYCQTTAQEVIAPIELFPDLELTVRQLEEKVRQRINGEFKERISLQTECDLFIRCALAGTYISVIFPNAATVHSVAFAAIIALLRELEAVCDPALMALTRTTWINHELVTRQSPYIGDLVRVLESITEAIVPLVESKKYLRNFFDKASR